jgi:hypothetical protein
VNERQHPYLEQRAAAAVDIVARENSVSEDELSSITDRAINNLAFTEQHISESPSITDLLAEAETSITLVRSRLPYILSDGSAGFGFWDVGFKKVLVDGEGVKLKTPFQIIEATPESIVAKSLDRKVPEVIRSFANMTQEDIRDHLTQQEVSKATNKRILVRTEKEAAVKEMLANARGNLEFTEALLEENPSVKTYFEERRKSVDLTRRINLWEYGNFDSVRVSGSGIVFRCSQVDYEATLENLEHFGINIIPRAMKAFARMTPDEIRDKILKRIK